jgi:hypothetical protein
MKHHDTPLHIRNHTMRRRHYHIFMEVIIQNKVHRRNEIRERSGESTLSSVGNGQLSSESIFRIPSTEEQVLASVRFS